MKCHLKQEQNKKYIFAQLRAETEKVIIDIITAHAKARARLKAPPTGDTGKGFHERSPCSRKGTLDM